MIIDPSNALCGPGFLPGLRLPERRLTVNRRRRRRGAVARRGWGASQARAASGRPGRPGLRAPKWRPPRGAGRAPRAPGARPRGWSSCPPLSPVRPSVVPERAAGLRWVGGAVAALPAGPRARAAVCGRGLPRVRLPVPSCCRARARCAARREGESAGRPSGGGGRGGGGDPSPAVRRGACRVRAVRAARGGARQAGASSSVAARLVSVRDLRSGVATR